MGLALDNWEFDYRNIIFTFQVIVQEFRKFKFLGNFFLLLLLGDHAPYF